MAHECPDCGMLCHCGGDIDDCCFSGTKYELHCKHCEGKDDSADEENIEPPTYNNERI